MLPSQQKPPEHVGYPKTLIEAVLKYLMRNPGVPEDVIPLIQGLQTQGIGVNLNPSPPPPAGKESSDPDQKLPPPQV